MTAALGFAVAHNQVGYHTQTFATFPSQVTGGPTWMQARIATMPILSRGDDLDVLVVFNREAYEMHKDIESGAFPKVGVNCYREDEEEKSVEFHPYNDEDTKLQIDSLNKVRSERSQQEVETGVEGVIEAARKGENVMPVIMAAVKAYATVGEITEALIQVYGRYEEPIRF